MGYHLDKQNGFIEHNGHNIDKIMHNGECVFSQGFDRESTGTDSVTCEGTIGKDLTDWSIVGDIVQDGIPGVDNPVDIKMVGDKTDNMFDIKTVTDYWKGLAYDSNVSYSGNTVFIRAVVQSFYSNPFVFSTEPIPVTISAKNITDGTSTNSRIGLCIVNSDGTVSNRSALNQELVASGKALSRTANAIYLDWSTPGRFSFSNIMLNKGSTSLPYEPYGVKIPVVSRGNNLFDASTQNYVSKTEYGLTWQVNSDNTITVNGTASGYTVFILANKYSIPSEYIGQKVTFNFNIFKNAKNIIWSEIVFYDDDDKNVGAYAQGTSSQFTIELQNSFKKFTAVVKRNNNVATSGTIGLILNLGDTSTKYEPYHPPITTPIYLKTPLAKNEVLRSNGDRNIEWKNYIFTGNETFSKNSSDPNNYLYFIRKEAIDNNIKNAYGYCSHLNVYPGAPISYIGCNLVNSYGVIYFNFGEDIMNSQPSGNKTTGIKEYLKSEYEKGTPVVVWYQLDIPTTETVDVPQIPTFRNEEKTILGTTTIITTDTEVKPSQIDAFYKSNKIEYVTLTDDNGNVTKMRKSDYDDLKTNEFLDILEVM